ncbi:group 3 secretory phospholipase A2 [Candoia aspera]|uniref:group 3 secretory phospholipase A2 n=1 Tax=Candoia aspera TaxID=51853 RepID=UPI002FD7DBD3
MGFSARVLPLLLLLALGLAPSRARGSWTEANTACHTRATGGRSRLLSFLWLRPDGSPAVLVQSLWDARSWQLLECAWRTEPALTRRYLELCAPGRLRDPLVRASWGPELRRELGALEARQGGCKGAPAAASSVAPAGGQEAQARPRTRRGLTLPGTLWCGAGDSASQSSELGVFQGPDVCCREHDQCDAHISPLGFKYGIRNYRLHTVSHCSCDNRFRDCLRNLSDTISNFIGTSFFNLLETPCFDLEESEECLEWHWWGGCKRYGPMPLAHMVDPSPYHPIEDPNTTTSPPEPRRHRGKGQKPSWKGRKGRKKLAEEKKGLPPKVQGPITPLTPTTKPDQATPIPGTSSSALSQRCRCYQRLDRCPFKIAPNEFRYQLHNSDDRTLFHCNCTRRLAQFLRRRKGPNEVEEEVLSHYVSHSCFVLEALPGCTTGEEGRPNCISVGKAILAPARHLTNRLTGKRAGASFKVKRQGRASLKGATKLFDKCVQLVRANLPLVPR